MRYFTYFALLLFFVATSTSATAQLTAKVYEDPLAGKIVQKHQNIAILPLDVIMTDTRSNKKKRTDPEELARQADLYQEGFQASMYSWFLKMKQKGRMGRIEIQDIGRTNALLLQSGIESSEDLKAYTIDQLSEILGVDGIFGGQVKTNVSFSKGGALALGLVVGFAPATGDADVFIKLWDCQTGKMIWSFSRVVASNYASDPEDVVNYLMKRVSKRFPYRS